MLKRILKLLLPCLAVVLLLAGSVLYLEFAPPAWLSMPSQPSAVGGSQDSEGASGSAMQPSLRPSKPTQPTIGEPQPSQEASQPVMDPVYPAPKPTKPNAPTDPDDSPEEFVLSARLAFVYDLTANQMLFLFGGLDEPVEPASITKLFSAYVGLQYLSPDTVLTVGEEVNWIDPGSSRANLMEGDQLTMAMCVQGMMIPSGNDAAYVLAVSAGRVIAGDAALSSREAYNAFVTEMNRMAWELGMHGSTFVNPDGMNEPGHCTTMRDMLLMAKLALENPLISQAATVAEMEVTLISGQTVNWINSNLLLHPEKSPFYCSDAIGLKTGSTETAKKCLLSAFRTEDRILLICVMGCPESEDRYIDTLTLYQRYG